MGMLPDKGAELSYLYGIPEDNAYTPSQYQAVLKKRRISQIIKEAMDRSGLGDIADRIKLKKTRGYQDE